MNLKKCHQWLLQKQFAIKKDFVTAIGDIFTHVTAITDPWVGNGCHKGAHRPKRQQTSADGLAVTGL